MAYGVAEDPRLNPMSVLEGADYPIWRATLVQIAEDSEAVPDVINLFKSLPRGTYESREDVLRDLAEAARRFGMGNRSPVEEGRRDRRNIGRDAVEGAAEGKTRHP